MEDRSNPPKLTIGVFIGIFSSYQNMLWRGISQVARENNINLISFVGAALEDTVGFRQHWNSIYNLASPTTLDGLIVMSAAIKSFVSEETLNQFVAPFSRQIPTISINQQLDNVPSILMNSSTGLSALFDHLIEDHHYKRIAFIRGPHNYYEAENRYRCYREALERHNLPFDPNLVTEGNFLPLSGTEAVKVLLDERQLTGIDAIAGANDGMIFGAWEELNRRGIDVPNDIALAGFDDAPDARSFVVPLTTVNAILIEHGRQSAHMLIDYLKSGKPPADKLIDTELVVRQSCGCLALPKTVPHLSTNPTDTPHIPFDTHYQGALNDIQPVMVRAFPELEFELVENLIQAFFDAVQGTSTDHFLTTLQYVLQKTTATLSRDEVEAGVMSQWHEVLFILREHTLPLRNAALSVSIDELLYLAQMAVTKASDQVHFNLRTWAEADLQIQSEMIRDINTALGMRQITDILAENLPKLGIQTAALALYEDDKVPAEYSRLTMLCHNGTRIVLDADGYLFPSHQLIPPNMLPHNHLPFLSVHPLVARDIHFGFLLLEMKPRNWSLYITHLALSEQIGAALHQTILQQQIKGAHDHLQKQAIALAETNLQLDKARQDAEQANQAKSSFLASMSHELRTPLNGIVNFTRFVADGILGPVNEKQVDALSKAVANSRHLLSLINDVLDISKIESGSLKLFVEENVDLAQELRDVGAIGEALLEGKPVALKINIEEGLPTIRADRRRMKQIVLNIVSNACKFTENGSITLSASHEEDNLLIAIQDTGPGIAQEDQAAVFETFRQTETGLRQGAGTGLGMPISSRLAEAHGGQLWLESEVGKGSTFYVKVPIKSPSLQPTFKE